MWNIIEGDSYEVLKQLPKKSVQCIITSPPYFFQRDYETQGQLGLESTPEEYVENLVKVFSESKKVLKDDGVLWIVINDTYCGGGGYCPTAPSNLAGSLQSHNRGVLAKPRPVPPGNKHKDLLGVPWMTALALKKDGWYLRCDNIWEKTNCSPENVTDRCTRVHEYVFLLSKSKKYFYDYEAIKEEAVTGGKRNKRSVWKINNKPVKGAHTAVFPEELVEVCLLAGSRPGDTVLDPFTGSGSTGVVALKQGRSFIGIDLNTKYCQLARERISGIEQKSVPVPKSS